jgi:hypothetical protein
MSPARFVDLWRSHNLLATALEPDALAHLLREIEHDVAGDADLPIPYRCRAFTVTRIDP